MSTKSLLRTDAWLLLAALLLAVPAFAGKDDDYKAAVAAAGAGKAEEAARLYCKVAQEDAAYKDAKMMCGIMQKEAQKETQRNEDRFQEGVQAFNAGHFDDAKQKFQNVRTGPRVEEARQYVNSKIPAAIQAKEREASAGAEAAVNQKFDQAVQAYNRNDFNGARSLFSQVTGGSRAGDAQNYLNRMKQYDAAMAEGERLASAKNYKAAQGSYNEAATLKGDGPGDPRGKANQMASLGSGSTAAAPVTTATAPPPVTTSSTTTAPPRAPVALAVKEPSKPKVDVGKLLAEAESAKAKGDIASAKSKYIAVLAADERNAQARVGLETLPKETGPAQQKASSEADVMLAKGIREFYQGLFEKAETHISDYLDVNGSKTGLSHFYMGASKLTRFYLGGERDAGLKRDADAAFRLAKKTSGFNPPGESFLSPKILKAYQDVNQ